MTKEEDLESLLQEENDEGIYEGDFKNGKRDGKGKCTWSNGDIYEGEWKDGKWNGKGILATKDGELIKGKWKNDELILKYEEEGESESEEKNYEEDKQEYEDEIVNNEVEEIKEDINNMPGIPLTDKKREIMLLEYTDDDFSNKEEREFYRNQNVSYFARMDTDIKYNNKMYYKKFYISKENYIEKKEKGVYNSSGVYISPTELRSMGKEGLISIEEIKKSILEEYDDGTTIIFWQSPIAELFYDKEKNKKQINDYFYNTMLKREFSFEPFKYYNTYVAGNKLFKDGTVDNFLIKVLLDKKDSNELTDIIYTIQSNQNKIIRTDSQENFIVQGCAGSGKTMILLHRLSYLKFNNLLPRYEKIKIITPNKLFNNFIKNLTKDLSIEEIEQTTIENYYLRLNNIYIERYNKIEEIDERFYRRYKERCKQEFIIENLFNENEKLNDKMSAIYSHDMINMIKNEYNSLMAFYNQEVEKNKFEVENTYYCNQIYYEQVIKKITKKIEELDSDLKNISEICEDKEKGIKEVEDALNNLLKENINNNLAIKKIKDECEKIEKEKEKELKKKKIFFENARNSTKAKQYDEVLKDKYAKIQKLKSRQSKVIEEQAVKTKTKKELTQKLEEYEKVKKNTQIDIDRFQELKEEILDNTYFTIDIYKYIMAKIRDKLGLSEEKYKYSKINLVVFLYINYLHIGELMNNDKLLCIDEAQDYSEIEFEILKKVNRNVVINLYGDINQSIYKNGIYNWDNLIKTLNLNMYVLNENYRNPSEITDYCNEKFGYDILSMGLSIKAVEMIKREQMNEIINQKIKDNKKIAVISKNNLKGIIENELISYCNIQSAKGIEYNTVIVDNKDMSENEKYIAYTRALSELYILED